MTLCIGAVCNSPVPGLPDIFVLCTDRKLDNNQWGSNDRGVKTHTIGHNWLAMMAGLASSARKLCAVLEGDITAGPSPQNATDMFSILLSSAKRFTESSLCKEEDACNLLFTGFLNNGPSMIWLDLKASKIEADFAFDKFAIGEGADMATAMLNFRSYDILDMPFEKACYLLYEAKKFSESVGSVGEATRMTIHAPLHPGMPDVNSKFWHGSNLNEEGFAKLEAMRSRCFMQPLGDFEPLLPYFDG